MITDKMLKEAIIKADNALLDELEKEECEHVFSDEFEFKMKSIIKSVKPRRRKVVLKSIASIFIICLLTGSAFVFSETELGAACSTWIKTQYDKIMSYRMADYAEGEEGQLTEYNPEWLPYGYRKSGVVNGADMKVVIYSAAEGQSIRFMYTKKGSITIEQDNHEYIELKVVDCYAELYISNNSEVSSKIVWIDEDEKIMFCISAFLEAEELIKIAESVAVDKWSSR